MESRTRIKVVAFALMAVFLASVAVASFASASNSNIAGQGVYLTFAMSKGSPSFQYLTDSWQSVVSISVPYISYSAWYFVSTDGYTWCTGTMLRTAIGVDSLSPDMSTLRHYGDTTISLTKTGIHGECMYYLGPGAHTFYFLAHRYFGTSTCSVAYNKITVIFFTDAYVSNVAGAEVVGTTDGPR